MRGRKPKPASAQVAAGDPRKRGKHKLQAAMNAEPPATKGLPECPDHLTQRARECWDFVADEITKMNLDRRPDALMLEGICLNYARAVSAAAAVCSRMIVAASRLRSASSSSVAAVLA